MPNPALIRKKQSKGEKICKHLIVENYLKLKKVVFTNKRSTMYISRHMKSKNKSTTHKKNRGKITNHQRK